LPDAIQEAPVELEVVETALAHGQMLLHGLMLGGRKLPVEILMEAIDGLLTRQVI
jgi:hypothetical protein